VPDLDAGMLVEDLRRAGMRVTTPRRVICEVIAASHDEHLTATEVHARAEAMADRGIDVSTVYRTIEALESVGRLHHVHLGHGPAVLHLSDHADHHHLVCEQCGRAQDIPLEEVADLVSHLEERYDFVAAGVHFALVGRCVGHDAVPGNSP